MNALPLTSSACPESPSLVSVRAIIYAVCLMTAVCSSTVPADDVPALAPLPKTPPPDAAQAAIGRQLFFDPRLSGDATISCATCHDPEHGWADGQALSRGYPGSKYFRNTPTVLNAVHGTLLYWDGRLPASDIPTVVRDHISEAHFFQADGRLIIERLRQVPEYEEGFRKAFGGEPSYGRILNAVTAFLQTLISKDVPFDRFLQGDESALTKSARRGHVLFVGRAGCVQCHHGPMLTDGRFHSLGLTSSPEIFSDPQRHITFRRFFRTLGVPGYEQLRQDPGVYCVSKEGADKELFRTPTLREVAATAPYMHDGQLATLSDVVAFYNEGGGERPSRTSLLQPLRLNQDEQHDLVAFLESLSGTPLDGTRPTIPPYQLRPFGENQ